MGALFSAFSNNAATIQLAAGGVNTAFGAYNSYRQARLERQAYEYQAAIAQQNQALAEQRAEDALRIGRLKERKHRGNVSRLEGRQRASFAARGLRLGVGTPLEILTQTEVFGEMDAGIIRENARREAYGQRMEAWNSGRAADLAGFGAESVNPLLAGTTSLLTGANTVRDQYWRFKERGVI